MPIVRRVRPTDLHSLNLCNLDTYTENYDMNFYLTYLMKWPGLFQCVEEDGGKIVAYIMGKLESTPPNSNIPPHLHLPWHGHVTILTVSPTHRRQGYARLLTGALEQSCRAADAYFVDLYVRQSNRAAIEMYEKMGYSVYRRVVGYYSDDLRGTSRAAGGGRAGSLSTSEDEAGEDGGADEDQLSSGGVGGEDAFDMRKHLPMDSERRYVRDDGREFRVDPEDVF